MNNIDKLPHERLRLDEEGVIEKVGAAVVTDRKVLVVRKLNQTKSDYYMAGGRMEMGETQLQTLERELYEELGIGIVQYQYLGSYRDLAVFEEVPIIIHAYWVIPDREPSVQSEIKEYKWIDATFNEKGIPVASIMAKKVIPELIKKNIL